MTKNIFKCEYYSDNDDVNVIGYCTNPIRHKKIKGGIALLHCQGDKCDLETKEKWW